MKRIPHFLFLAFFIYITIGYYVVFQIQRCQVKSYIEHQINNCIPEDELVVISFNMNSDAFEKLVWIEKDKEFRFNNQLFDVVEKKFNSETEIVYYCINDTKEAKIFANLHEHIQNQSENNGNQNAKNFIKKLMSEYIAPMNYFFIQFHSKTINGLENHVLLSQSCQDIATPPPNNI